MFFYDFQLSILNTLYKYLDFMILLQGEHSKYYKCDPEKTICQNLEHAKIIDYPHFTIVSREKLESYNIIERVVIADQ
ncbi:hypothetical protein BEWA_015610 [Theileria equi strain WA]|uniref:BCD1 alpha/beta domain-containing protein n=1 Tax=Theileria equi strain WA TaxID=1537102 RepID=L1LCM4_THEEQ|nr:hypothetical protein BEWA_015610 [Theileria equi strain WA]EKX73000.1 hypothetical protein BEWA_015610 [Theileria equi strain WA]|eukprot:XP_004832452.1 hypothetical protein BEWA_015610 [Theileria equi strain WA]